MKKMGDFTFHISQFAFLIVSVCLAAFPASARDRAGSTAANSLLRGTVGGAPAAMGGAYIAVADGPLAVRYNPAGLAGDDDRYRAFAQYDANILDINRGDVAFSMPFQSGGLGASFSYVDYGSITRTTTVNKTGAGSVRADDYLFRVAYGRAIRERLSLGASLAAYNLQIDNASASGVTVDLAAQFRPGPEGMTLAVALQNIGSRVKFYQDEEELPVTLVAGAAYRPDPRFLVTADIDWSRGLEIAIRAGAEYRIADAFAVRIGYDGRNEAGSGLTAGAGFRLRDLSLDYAFVPFGELGHSHRISAEWAFGGVRREESQAPQRASLPPVEVRMNGRAVKNTEASSASAAPPMPTPSPSTPTNPPLVEPATDPDAVVTAPPAPAATSLPPSPAPEPLAPRRMKPVRPIERILEEARAANAAGYSSLEQELYSEALRVDPKNVTALYNLATIHYLVKEFHLARDMYAAVTEESPRDAEAWLFLGLSERALGNAFASRDAFARVVALEPENEYARKYLGR